MCVAQVDRVIACSVSEADYTRDPSNPAVLFLVKWTALPYSECTWETVADVGSDQEIAEFWKRQRPPPKVPYPCYPSCWGTLAWRSVFAGAHVTLGVMACVGVVVASQDKCKTPKRPDESKFRMISTSDTYGNDPENPLTLRDYQVTGLNWLLFNWCVP